MISFEDLDETEDFEGLSVKEIRRLNRDAEKYNVDTDFIIDYKYGIRDNKQC